MNVLLIGSGGREHALALKISESKMLTKLFCVSGNPGTEKLSNNISLDISNHNLVVNFCKSEKIDLVVIGPEQPLVEGLSDSLRENDIMVFGPSANAARIESSKSFAKSIMKQANVLTADYQVFDVAEFEKAKKFLLSKNYPVVIKADGLAAGKGVIICNDYDQAIKTIQEIFEDKIFGESGNKIVIEEFLSGEEASVFAITDGENFICLPAAQDHKRIGEGDTGKNTGGMGAYAPALIINDTILKKIENDVIKPVLNELNKTGNKFIGCLYAGLMISGSTPKVIEFNCRFGDPETQVVLPILDGDFLELIYSAAKGNLKKNSVEYNGGCAVCVVAASKGYPDKFEKGFEIFGLEDVDPEVIIYHAGTKKIDGKIVTNGGRVLAVTAVLKSNNLKEAKSKAYNALSKINFKGIYFRRDISDKALKNIIS